MSNTFFLAFRNFVRQKRRNILLGSAIAFGVMMLTVSFAFTQGLTDIILNRIVIYMSGHMSVSIIEDGRVMSPVARDHSRITQIIKENVNGIVKIEDAVVAFSRGVGNGKSDYVFVVGLDIDQTFRESFALKEGDYTSFERTDIQPVFLSEEKAKALNTKIGDTINIRLININGQNNTGTLTVVGILKSQNVWMDFAVFTPKTALKKITGYLPHESGTIQLKLEDPKSAATQANILWEKLKPNPAYILAKTKNTTLCLVSKSDDKIEKTTISSALAKELNLSIGSKLPITYTSKFLGTITTNILIEAITNPLEGTSSQVIFLPKSQFFKLFNHAIPSNNKALSHYIANPKEIEKISTEWLRLKRAKTTEEYTKGQKNIQKDPSTQPVLVVSSMYEVASQVVAMENVLNMVALFGAGILLFIIMVGVLNSLRMTIRERTQEIGTMRALGMQKADIKKLFLWESVLLAISGWIVGIVFAFIVMFLLRLIHFSSDNPMNMLMIDHRLYFIPTIWHALQNLGLLMVFMLITAYLPAKRAAQLSPAVAFKGSKG